MPIRVTVPAVTVAPTALVGSLIRSSNLPHSLQRGVHAYIWVSLWNLHAPMLLIFYKNAQFVFKFFKEPEHVLKNTLQIFLPGRLRCSEWCLFRFPAMALHPIYYLDLFCSITRIGIT